MQAPAVGDSWTAADHALESNRVSGGSSGFALTLRRLKRRCSFLRAPPPRSHRGEGLPPPAPALP
eukprot:7988552-Alexandrium_andersonii.AAC.1